jgi:LmbE family N-acetylglucosaminyl deacetylase
LALLASWRDEYLNPTVSFVVDSSMLSLGLDATDNRPLRLLCLGAHCDDIEIGCGGTILTLAASRELDVRWTVFSSTAERECEARKSACAFLQNVSKKQITIQSFRDGFFPYHGSEVKESFEQLKAEFSPDLVLTHYRQDLHQDHRVVSDLTWNTFRDHLVLEYEIPKYDGDLGSPNFFVPLDQSNCQKKIDYLVNCFESQKQKQWFEEDTFLSLARLRGLECNAPEKYAEAFYCRKLIFKPCIGAITYPNPTLFRTSDASEP